MQQSFQQNHLQGTNLTFIVLHRAKLGPQGGAATMRLLPCSRSSAGRVFVASLCKASMPGQHASFLLALGASQ